MGPLDRADCPACGHTFQWGWEEAMTLDSVAQTSELVRFVHGDTVAVRDTEHSVGVCPACGQDGVIFTLNTGVTVRFNDGYAVVSLPQRKEAGV